jgi:peptidoglycan/xylan/chitin deacetylase (PgdA/CDA1 family)
MTFSSLLFLALLEAAPQVSPSDQPSATSDLPPGVKVMKAIPVDEPPAISLDGVKPTTPRIVFSQCKVNGNFIALTFDDGPHPQNTPRLLDMLKERGIKATFFLIGKSAATWPAIVKRIVDEGHQVANHTWDHKQLSIMAEKKVMDELQKTHTAILNASGTAPELYRPPYGAIKMTQKKMIMEHFHYPTILWDVDTLDWKSPRSIAKVHDTILRDAKPGSIILCHDIHVETIDAMPTTLDDLNARGFKFLTVSELIKLEAETPTTPVIAPAATPVLATPAAEAPSVKAAE